MRVEWKFIGRAQAYATRVRLPQLADLDLRTPDGSEVVLPTRGDFLILSIIGSGEPVHFKCGYRRFNPSAIDGSVLTIDLELA